ncbi:TRAP transporter permease [Bacillus sp. Marseille-P3661]|uniref:TRAP transporter permease n=1 Tax=Bacillus sp. Marseille-P3661 TaxID=1936234 RepID=UPI000C8596DF|nr:TRAP transporter fused permease subunit [Bacillus sp. Marseille-P3661]
MDMAEDKKIKKPEDKSQRHRTLTGVARWFQIAVSVLLLVLGMMFILKVHIRLGIPIYAEQWIGLFMSLFLFNTFLTVPATKRSPRDRLPWYDAILAIASIPSGIFIAMNYADILLTLGQVTNERVIYGAIAILLILESGRRLIGLSLVIIAAVFILYGAYGSLLPGAIAGAELSWGQLITYLYLDNSSTLNMLGLAATFGFAFVFFGQVLLKFGGGDGLTNIALLAFGKTRGGPAKAAVVGSSLVGTVSGAPMSNVFLTGSVTIPLMVRSGYHPRLAAAIEAVASSGGQITPPVMGIAAFIIAERLGIPYQEVAIAAIIPALLFYVAVFVQVDLEAGKKGLRKLSNDEMPTKKQTMQQAWPVLTVLFVLIYTLFVMNLAPATSAIYTGLIGIPIFALVKENRKDFLKKLWQIVEENGRMLLDVGSALGIAGMVVGIMNVSGLGFSIGYTLTLIGEHSLFLLLCAAAIGSLFLGMGMPSVAAYALVAVLVGPALVDFGLNPLAAHLFIFYFAILSNFTPPIALAAFAGAFIAQTNPIRTGITAARLGTLAYIVPFIFVYNPSMIMQGEASEIIISVLTAIVGTFVIGAGLVGYIFSHQGWPARILILASGGALLYPVTGVNITLGINIVGFVIAVIMVMLSYKNSKKPIINESESLQHSI